MAVVNPPAYIQASSHPADVFRRALRALREQVGVVQTGDLAVSQNGSPNMSVNVAAGIGVVDGTENAVSQGTYVDLNDAVVNLAIAAADPTNPRNDLIVLKIQDAQYSGATNAASLVVVQGTPAGSPVDPATPNNAIVLARVRVGAGVASITNANITDLRTSAQGQVIPGLAGFVIRDSGNTRNNWAIDDTGLVTMRNALKVPPSVGGTLAPSSYGHVPVKIDQATLGAANATLYAGGTLPTGFRHLEVVYTAILGVTAGDLGIRFNGDAGANYDYQALEGSAGSVASSSNQAAKTYIRVGFLNSAATPSAGRIIIALYGGTTFQKTVLVIAHREDANGNTFADIYTGQWRSTAAITSISLVGAAGTVGIGSTVDVYGIP